MNLKPLGDRIIVRHDQAQETTAGGLYIAPDSEEKPQTGVVLAVGEGRIDRQGPAPSYARERGRSRSLWRSLGGTEVDVDGEAVLILRADDIYAVYTD